MKKTIMVMSLVVRIKTPPHHIYQIFCPSCSICKSECFRLSEKVRTWFKKTLKLESDLVREYQQYEEANAELEEEDEEDE